MAGRIYGALLLADPPEVSSAELAEMVGVSSGSVSTATRELIRAGHIERVGLPGDRKDYFRARAGTGAIAEIMRDGIAAVQRLEMLMGEGDKLVKRKDPSVGRRLGEIREFYRFLEDEMRGIIDRWEELQRAHHKE